MNVKKVALDVTKGDSNVTKGDSDVNKGALDVTKGDFDVAVDYDDVNHVLHEVKEIAVLLFAREGPLFNAEEIGHSIEAVVFYMNRLDMN